MCDGIFYGSQILVCALKFLRFYKKLRQAALKDDHL